MARIERLEGYQWRVERVLIPSSNGNEQQFATRLTFLDPVSKHALEVNLGDDARRQLAGALSGGVVLASEVNDG